MLAFIKENSLVEVYPSIILLYIINNKYNIFKQETSNLIIRWFVGLLINLELNLTHLVHTYLIIC